MSLDLEENTPDKPHRSIGFAIIGLLLLLGAAYVYYGALQDRPVIQTVPYDYEYTTKQNIRTKVQYEGSSFFEDGPTVTDTAYVTDLTKAIDVTFNYDYTGSKPTDLTYSYDVKATVKGTYPLKNDGSTVPKVWSKEYVLKEPESNSINSKNFSISPSVEVPFTDYMKDIDEFNKSLNLLVNGEVVVSMTVRVNGEIDGTPFNNVKVSSVTAPLDQQIYQLSVQYDKKNTNQVVSEKAAASWNPLDHIQEIVAGTLGLLGAILLFVGFKRQIFKSPYQRELDRIYRLHDGIIIRASRPAELDGKNVVAVRSFDDLLNLEEELKTPIVASPAGGEATHFVIIHNDVAYVYTLGKVLVEDGAVDEIEEALHPVRAQRVREAAKKPKRPRKIM